MGLLMVCLAMRGWLVHFDAENILCKDMSISQLQCNRDLHHTWYYTFVHYAVRKAEYSWVLLYAAKTEDD